MSADNRATSETYVTDDDGDRIRTYTEGGYRLTIIDDERTVVEGTEEHNRAFAAKMAEWRRTGGIPHYGGPRAAR